MCSIAALPGGKRQNVYNRLCEWREKEKVGWIQKHVPTC